MHLLSRLYHIRFAVLFAVTTFAVAAHADTYQIAITSGTDSITFNVPSSPLNPQQTGTGGFELNNLMFNYDGKKMTGDVAFYPTSSPFPGIEAQVGLTFFATEGIQVFTGSTQAPTFILGNFTSNETVGLAGSRATVNITDLTPPPPAAVTPEPSSIVLLATGAICGASACLRRFRAA